jgi:hypothetical protein
MTPEKVLFSVQIIAMKLAEEPLVPLPRKTTIQGATMSIIANRITYGWNLLFDRCLEQIIINVQDRCGSCISKQQCGKGGRRQN